MKVVGNIFHDKSHANSLKVNYPSMKYFNKQPMTPRHNVMIKPEQGKFQNNHKLSSFLYN